MTVSNTFNLFYIIIEIKKATVTCVTVAKKKGINLVFII
jgi:hypothetical protein